MTSVVLRSRPWSPCSFTVEVVRSDIAREPADHALNVALDHHVQSILRTLGGDVVGLGAGAVSATFQDPQDTLLALKSFVVALVKAKAELPAIVTFVSTLASPAAADLLFVEDEPARIARLWYRQWTGFEPKQTSHSMVHVRWAMGGRGQVIVPHEVKRYERLPEGGLVLWLVGMQWGPSTSWNGAILHVTDDVVTLGSAADNILLVPGTAPRHLEFSRAAAGWRVRCLVPQRALAVNGIVRDGATTPLVVGSVLELEGRHYVVVRAD